MEIDLQEILEYVQEHIPITVHLGVTIESYDGVSLRIGAPLAENLNHRNSVFGGSLSSVAILSGWALLFIKLREEGIRSRLVIQKTEFDFSDPVTADFDAVSVLPSVGQYERFIKMLRRRGRARLVIPAEVTCEGKMCDTHQGTFVAVLLRDEGDR